MPVLRMHGRHPAGSGLIAVGRLADHQAAVADYGGDEIAVFEFQAAEVLPGVY